MSLEFRIAELKTHLLELEKEVKALANVPTAFEVGKWYHLTEGKSPSCLMRVSEVTSDQIKGYFIGETHSDLDGTLYTTYLNRVFRPATESEVSAALIKESEKRGYKDGARIKSINFLGSNYTMNDCKPEYYAAFDQLSMGGTDIYRQGQWAEIIKQDEVRIGGGVVTYRLNGCGVTIGGNVYAKGDIEDFAGLLKLPKISGIEVTKCSGEKVIVTASDIDKVLKAWAK